MIKTSFAEGQVLGWNGRPTKFARRYHCFKAYSETGASVSLCQKYTMEAGSHFSPDPFRNHKNTCAVCERELEKMRRG